MSKGARNRKYRREQQDKIDMGVVHRTARTALLDAEKEFLKDETACILWALHETFDFGPKPIRRFYDNYERLNNELREHYESSVEDLPWICRDKLAQIGIDLDQWMEDHT